MPLQACLGSVSINIILSMQKGLSNSKEFIHELSEDTLILGLEALPKPYGTAIKIKWHQIFDQV